MKDNNFKDDKGVDAETARSRDRIRQLVREFYHPDETSENEEGRVMGHGGSAKMARSALFNVSRGAQSLHDRLNDEDELPEWVQSKLAAMQDDMDEIKNHLDHKLHKAEQAEDAGTPDPAPAAAVPTLATLFGLEGE